MAVARVTELVSSSPKSIEDAIQAGLKRGMKKLRGVTGFEVTKISGKIEGDKFAEYRVHMSMTFILEG